MKVGVVGGGVAGTAAAWALRRLAPSVRVTLLHDRPGASSLYSGAVDEGTWEEAPVVSRLHADVVAFAAALEAWSVGPGPCLLATDAGVVRPARGRDTALLDLALVAGRRVGVADLGLRGWDAAALARALGASAWASETSTRFECLAVGGWLEGAERELPAFEVALLLDDPARQDGLARSLASTAGAPDAWLLPPILGSRPGAAERVAVLTGSPTGETTSPPGGAAGARFESARDALLHGLDVTVQREEIRQLSRSLTGWQLLSSLECDRVILATGGVAAGGIRLEGGAFLPSVAGPLVVGLHGRVHVPAGSVDGLDFTGLGLGALERVGILVDGTVARGTAGIHVAGDAVEGRPRTALEAARSGVLAARACLAP